MSKIKLTELSAYFPYKVKAIFNETDKKGCRKKVIGTVSMIYDNCSINCYDTVNSCPDKYKLILYPPYVTTRQDMVRGEFLKRRIDIFNLIQRGLAVDVNELPTNPYKKTKK